MEHSKVYQYRFDELLKIVRHGRSFHKSEEREDDQVIDICGNGFREYQSIVSHNESWVVYTVDKIVQGLFDQEGIKYNVPEYEEKSPSGRMRKINPFSFAMREKKGNIAYIFLYRQRKGLIEIRNDIRRFKGIDGVKFVFLQRDFKEQIDILNRIESEDDNSFLEFYGVREFFDEKFGVEEFPIFMEYVEKFNERARNLIGFKTVAMPTEDAIKRFREKKADLLNGIDYDSLLPNEINLSQKRIIIDNYISNNRYMIMIGNRDFADSFVSSEWYYGIHTVTGTIDQTGLVTGYLKSVEQLLYALIRLFIGKNRRISINTLKKNQFSGQLFSGRFIDFTEENEFFADTTLGSLIRFVKKKNKTGGFYNADLFSVDEHTIQVIIDALYAFKDVERNDHLHKDNLYASDEVDDIREKAMTLYCLLLGSFKINSGDYAKLMAYDTTESLPESIDEEELLEIITEWATPVIMFDMPKELHTVAFHITKFVGKDWDLCLQGLEKIPEKRYKTIEWNHRMIYSSSITSNRLTWKSEGEYKDEIEKLLRVLRKMIEGDSEVATMLRKYPEVVIGEMEVIEVLYTKKG